MTVDIRQSVLAALDTTTGLMNRPDLAVIALSGGDFPLASLDIDSLSAYEVIMQLEEEFEVEIAPAAVLASETLSDLIAAVSKAVSQAA